MTIRCVAVPFTELDTLELYALAKLRQDVFVVEQQCPFPDLDGRDLEPATRHVLLAEDGLLIGCARVVDDGDVWCIGRVLLAPAGRGRGLGDLVMQTALEVTTDRPVVLDAQAPLAGWYSTFGFEVSGPEFVEDGIAHVPMSKAAS